jgi:AcrR family transcriptional regulator
VKVMPSRQYRSDRRTEAAAETRTAILEAALAQFEASGYRASTLPEIADRARVSVNTVYSSVGGKPQLLVALIESASRDDRIDEAMARALAADSGREVLKIVADGTQAVFEAHTWALGVLYDNAAADPAIAEAVTKADRAYASRLSAAAARLEDLHALRPGVAPARATAILLFYFGFRPWRELRGSGWSWGDASEWLLEQATRALLTEQAPAPE